MTELSDPEGSIAETVSPVAVTVTDEIADAIGQACAELAKPGTWWTGAERVAIAARARALFAERASPPWLRTLPDPPALLGPEIVDIVDRITLDAGSIDRAWATGAIQSVGEGRYVELVGLVATTVMLDVHAEGVGVAPLPLPDPIHGEPARTLPDGLGHIGAHVRMIHPSPFANVARALSLVPDTNRLFRLVMMPNYSANGFEELRWDTPLSRPQVELVASRVAAMNECFY
ncbi:MAG: hypothetical protein AAF547_18935 [Actinomycetota bacterium]